MLRGGYWIPSLSGLAKTRLASKARMQRTNGFLMSATLTSSWRPMALEHFKALDAINVQAILGGLESDQRQRLITATIANPLRPRGCAMARKGRGGSHSKMERRTPHT